MPVLEGDSGYVAPDSGKGVSGKKAASKTTTAKKTATKKSTGTSAGRTS